MRLILRGLSTLTFVCVAAAAQLKAEPMVAAYERFLRAAASEHELAQGGLLLLNELNCVACHAAPSGWRERLPGRDRISLAGVGSRLEMSALREFIAGPQRMKPGTVMPALVRDATDAASLAAWLSSLRAPVKSFPNGDAERGRQLFERVGCAACHSPGDTRTTYASVPIGLAARYDRQALAAFLQDPLHSRPAGRMPSTELSDAEAADLAAYLNPAPPAISAAPSSTDNFSAGRSLFSQRGCIACHDVGHGESVSTQRGQPLVELRANSGCLAPPPARNAPEFFLADAQRAALAAALRAVQATPTPPPLPADERVAMKFAQLNCYACHEWRGRGGAEPARASLFVASDSAAESLGELGHLPPKLDQAGRKLTRAWLEKLLWGRDGGVRPYLSARMPRYGQPAAGELVSLLAEACRPAQPQDIDVSGSKGHQRSATGRTLLGTGTGGLGCVACHGLKNREPAGVRAINLTHTARRLQPEYFKALLLDPQGVQPGTIMPPLLGTRKEPDKDIESIWTYFKELDQNDVLPDGLAVAGSFELKPREEGRPIVFRTFLEGAGTQAIAVGFPAGAHAAFDAFEVRWAVIWRGRFLDAQSNWEERPMKPIQTLGDARRTLPTHLPLARLPSPDAPWPAAFGTYAGYHFKGYRLAADGTPTFRYEIDGLQVEDTLRPRADGQAFQRTVVIRRAKATDATWYFRGAGTGLAPQPIEWRDGVATFEETLSF